MIILWDEIYCRFAKWLRLRVHIPAIVGSIPTPAIVVKLNPMADAIMWVRVLLNGACEWRVGASRKPDYQGGQSNP